MLGEALAHTIGSYAEKFGDTLNRDSQKRGTLQQFALLGNALFSDRQVASFGSRNRYIELDVPTLGKSVDWILKGIGGGSQFMSLFLEVIPLTAKTMDDPKASARIATNSLTTLGYFTPNLVRGVKQALSAFAHMPGDARHVYGQRWLARYFFYDENNDRVVVSDAVKHDPLPGTEQTLKAADRQRRAQMAPVQCRARIGCLAARPSHTTDGDGREALTTSVARCWMQLIRAAALTSVLDPNRPSPREWVDGPCLLTGGNRALKEVDGMIRAADPRKFHTFESTADPSSHCL